MKRINRKILSIINFLLAPRNMMISKGTFKDCYPAALFTKQGFILYPEIQSKHAQILRVSCLNEQGISSSTLRVDCPIRVEVDFCVRIPKHEINISFMIHHWRLDTWVSATSTAMSSSMPTQWSRGQHRIQMEFPSGILNCGKYYIRVGIGCKDGTVVDYHPDGLSLELVATGPVLPHSIHSHGLLAIVPRFVIVPVDDIVSAQNS